MCQARDRDTKDRISRGNPGYHASLFAPIFDFSAIISKRKLEMGIGISTVMRPMPENSETEKRSRTPMDFSYNDVEMLNRFTSESGKILPRRITGLTPKQQRHIARQVKRARQLLLMK